MEPGANRGQNRGMTHARRDRLILVGVGCLAMGLGCSGSATQMVGGVGADAAAPPSDSITFDPDADTFIPCTNDPRAEHYEPGMQKVAPKGQLSVTLLSSMPGPPIKGNNTWTILLADSAKVPQTGATFNIKPFMPDHGHGSPATTVAKPLADAGQYTVAPVYLFMAGLWEVTLDVTTAAGVRDAIVFKFCIEQ
jgi:hypothetical protein